MSRSPDTTIWRRALMEEAVAFDAAAREYVAALNDNQPGWPRLLDVSERILLIKLGILDPASVVDGPHHMHGRLPDSEAVTRAAEWIRRTFGTEPPKDILLSASLTPESTRRRMQVEIEHAAKNESGSPYSPPTWTGEPFYDRETGFVASGTPTDAKPTVPKGGGEVGMTTEGSQKSGGGEENRGDAGAAREPTYAELTNSWCPDGGRCHHDCEKSCWRVHNAGPLSVTGWDDGWPESVKAEHRKREATRTSPPSIEDAILSYTPPEDEREEAIEAISASMQKVEKPSIGMLRYMPTHSHSMEVRCGQYCPVRQWREHTAKWGDPYEKLTELMGELRRDAEEDTNEGGK